jgi:hypothetical protein
MTTPVALPLSGFNLKTAPSTTSNGVLIVHELKSIPTELRMESSPSTSPTVSHESYSDFGSASQKAGCTPAISDPKAPDNW